MSLNTNSIRTWPVPACLMLFACLFTHARGQEREADPVLQMTGRAKAFLYTQQQADGSWETTPLPGPEENWHGHSFPARSVWGGRTALTTYALLAAGEKSTDPRIVRAVEWLKKNDPNTGTYVTGFRMLVWMNLPPTDDVRKHAKQDAQRLLQLFTRDGLAWYAPQDMYQKTEFRSDTSNAQVAALGLWAASFLDVEIPRRAWQSIDRGWRQLQSAEGTWPYNFREDWGKKPHPGLTAAGVATLFITQEMLAAPATERGNVADTNLEKARSWIASNFEKVVENDYFGRREIYALYALERCGVAGGYRYFGTSDWYDVGVRFLRDEQRDDGSWRERVEPKEPDGVVDTAFALLILSYGRAPFAVTKLEYQSEPSKGEQSNLRWHQRPRDVANLTRWMSRSLEKHLNWQILPATAKLNDLLDAPVLYISGDRAFTLTDPELNRLREYVQRGGLIVGNADAGSSAFAGSFRKMVSDLFPQYESRVLRTGHPILSNSQYSSENWRRPVRIDGTSNGVRELAILFPNDDPGRWTHNRDWRARPESFESLANIILYAVDKTNFQPRVWRDGDRRGVDASERSVNVARLKYTGNWDPEPAAWQVYASARPAGTPGVKTAVVDLEQAPPSVTDYPVMHWTGTGAFQLTDVQKQRLGDYLKGGGTLIVEAAGGTGEFAAAAEAVIHGLQINGTPLKPVADDDPVYVNPGPVLRNALRPYVVKAGGIPPKLLVAEIDGRRAVYFSDADLTAGMLGLRHDGIHGHAPDAARQLVGNILSSVARK